MKIGKTPEPLTALSVMGLPVCLVGALLAGCVMTEKYEAEKAHALNFQRLLAQEEKRTAELDSELKRAKREASELEARNREMVAQLQAVREQMAKIQDETEALRQEAAALREREKEELSRPRPSVAKPKRREKAPAAEAALQGLALQASKAEGGSPTYHEVKRGETLFRIARQYRVKVDDLRKWNNLPDNTIEVGQRLVIGYE